MKKKLIAFVVLASVVLFSAGVPVPFAGTASALDTFTPLPQPNSCTPYGPWEGYQYDPALLMQKLGEPRDKAPITGPYLSAHRGAWGTQSSGLPQSAAENSITAIDNAAQMKFEMVELDVHMSSDNKLVLAHDYTMGRTTNYTQSGSGHWDVFNQVTPEGITPILSGNPPLLTNWRLIRPYNPLVNYLTAAEITSTQMRIFDKSAGTQGTMNFGGNTVTAKGTWTVVNETVPTLLQALQHIGNNYPGMTVVLDLRHLDEVTEAMNVIDQVTDCQGNPAKDWVILKPFANVFPYGYVASAPNDPYTVLGKYGSRANNYKWIPVVSFRLVPPNPQGTPSVIPGSPGPDISQIAYDALTYLRNHWPIDAFLNIVTYENGYNGTGGTLQSAYDWALKLVKNMKSWRPPDVDVVSQVVNPANGKTIIGLNWKDDGMGAYPVYKEDFQGYEKIRENASVITVDDAPYVLKMEIATRDAAMMSISKLIDAGKVRTDLQYELLTFNGLSALDLNNNDADAGNRVQIWQENNGLGQTWLLKRVPETSSPYYYILHRDSGKVLEMKAGTQYDVQLNSYDYNVDDFPGYNPNQVWKLQYNSGGPFNGTYTIVNLGNDYALNVEGEGISNGTKVIAWPQTPNAYNEKWNLTPATSLTLQDQSSSKVIAVLGGNTSDNAAVGIFDNGNYKDQEWRFVNRGDGTYYVLNPYTGKALTIYGGDDQPVGQKVVTYTPGDGENQRWKILYNRSDNTYTLMNPQTGFVLNIEGAFSANGTSVIVWDTQSDFYPNEKLKFGIWGAIKLVANTSDGTVAMSSHSSAWGDMINVQPVSNGGNISWINDVWLQYDVANKQTKFVWKFHDASSGRYIGLYNNDFVPQLIDETDAMFFELGISPVTLGYMNMVLRYMPDPIWNLEFYNLNSTGSSQPITWALQPEFYALH